MTLLGLPLVEAERILKERGEAYTVTWYASKKPYNDADSARVVRAGRRGGSLELVVCEFKTVVREAS